MSKDNVIPADIRTQKRIFVLLGLVLFIFVVLCGRLFWLQVVRAGELQGNAKNQWLRNLVITPVRGTMYDCNKQILAKSIECETVLIQLPKVSEKAEDIAKANQNAEAIAAALSPILGFSREYIFNRCLPYGDIYQRTLKRQLTTEQADAIRKLNLPGVILAPDRIRVYPGNELFGRVLGYTDYDMDGQSGLEQQYNEFMKGVKGSVQRETTRSGEDLPNGYEELVEPVPGLNLMLTMDANIQHFAQQAVDEAAMQYNPVYAGCMVMDVNTGGILACAVSPSMNLNVLPREDITTLLAQSRNPMLQDSYDPGSTFKVITTAAALEEGVANNQRTFTCDGGRTVLGTKIHCWKRTGAHGTQDLKMGVRNSCNSVFMDLARDLGKDRFYDYLDKFGFGRVSGIDFPSEARGIINPVQYVTEVDLACMGFGQSISVTPLQLMSAFSTVVNGGYQVSPHMVKAMTDMDGKVVENYTPPQGERVISEQTSTIMRDILEFTVRDGIKGAYIPGYRVGGKTGTSQKFFAGSLVQGKHVSSFIGFAPADNPKFAVLMIVDEPQTAVDFGSVVAAPHAGRVIEKTLVYMKVPKEEIPGEAETLKTIALPNVVGLAWQEAQDKLAAVGLEAYFSGSGSVVAQDPAPGTQVHTGTLVRMVTTTPYPDDVEIVTMPDCTGLSVSETYSMMTRLGLQLKITGTGLAANQSQPAGAQLRAGSIVTVKFEPAGHGPDPTGLSPDPARASAAVGD